MPKISPTQALLILLEKYEKDESNSKKLELLLMRGVCTEKDRQAIESFFKDPILTGYEIAFDPKKINEDPSRRFFETVLAHETLKLTIKDCDPEDILAHEKALTSIGHTKDMLLTSAQDTFSGRFTQRDDIDIKEYASYIHKIMKGIVFQEVPVNDREKILHFVKAAFIGVISGQLNALPIDVYGRGIFSDEARGKVLLKNQGSTRSDFHTGIMKSYMPVPREGAAYTESETPFLRASDKATFVEDSEWARKSFGMMVHPFSNSISGTMLVQLRNIRWLLDHNKPLAFLKSPEKLQLFMKDFGNHSPQSAPSGRIAVMNLTGNIFDEKAQIVLDRYFCNFLKNQCYNHVSI